MPSLLQCSALLHRELLWKCLGIVQEISSHGEEAEPRVRDADSPGCSCASALLAFSGGGDARRVYLELIMSTFREGFHHGRLRRLIKPRSGSSWTVTQMFPLALCFIGSIHGGL